MGINVPSLEHEFATTDQGRNVSVPLASIVILNNNGLSRLQACLDAILGQDYDNFEIVFVDNGSSDGSLEWVVEKLANSPHAHHIEKLPFNAGVNRGKNRGASIARGRYLWLLDNDIAPEPSTLRSLVTYMEQHDDVALCSPVLSSFNDTSTIIGGGFHLNTWYRPSTPLRSFSAVKREGILVSYVSGGAMMVRAQVWRQLGGFEEDARFYLDDTDYGVRCWLSGYKVALLPSARARHWDGPPKTAQQQSQRFVLHITGVTRFILRNFSFSTMSVHLTSFEIFLLLRTLKHVLRYRRPSFILDYLRGQYLSIKHASKTFAERRRIQQHRSVDNDVFLHLHKVGD